jgi:hypothetical protein
MSILCRGYGDKIDLISIPKGKNTYEIKKKWAVLARGLHKLWYEKEAYGMYNCIVKIYLACY